MNVGWIKLHRSLLSHPRYSDDKWSRVFIHLLLLAKFRPCKATFMGRVIVLRPGQFTTNLPEIASALKIHESSVQRILQILKTDRQIDWEPGNKSRLITIVNWEKFQGDDDEEFVKPTDRRQATDRQATGHPVVIKNGKKEKNGKNALPSEETLSSRETPPSEGHTPLANANRSDRGFEFGYVYGGEFLPNQKANQLAATNEEFLLNAKRARRHGDGRIEEVR